MTLKFGGEEWSGAPSYDAPEFTFEQVELPVGKGAFEVFLQTRGKLVGAYQVFLSES